MAKWRGIPETPIKYFENPDSRDRQWTDLQGGPGGGGKLRGV